MMTKLEELGADICSETLDGDNALSILAGHEETLAIYIAEHYDVTQFDRPDQAGITPLMYAALKGYNKLARVLIGRGLPSMAWVESLRANRVIRSMTLRRTV